MREMAILLAAAALLGCAADPSESEEAAAPTVTPASLSFEGADYGQDEAAKVAHGDRLASVLLCRGCHMPDLTGTDMGRFEAELDGIVASNLTRTISRLDDDELELLLRKGVHPERDPLYLMPSKIYQHVSAPDMAALIAYLRTLEPAGEALPGHSPNPELAAAISAGEFPTAREEVAHHAEKLPAELGSRHALGRYVATTVCADCHGATLRGETDFGPDLAAMGAAYDEAALTRLLATGEAPDGRELPLMGFIGAELLSQMTERERAAVVAYVKALGAREMEAGQ